MATPTNRSPSTSPHQSPTSSRDSSPSRRKTDVQPIDTATNTLNQNPQQVKPRSLSDGSKRNVQHIQKEVPTESKIINQEQDNKKIEKKKTPTNNNDKTIQHKSGKDQTEKTHLQEIPLEENQKNSTPKSQEKKQTDTDAIQEISSNSDQGDDEYSNVEDEATCCWKVANFFGRCIYGNGDDKEKID